jgi:hypothetical protein
LTCFISSAPDPRYTYQSSWSLRTISLSLASNKVLPEKT